jgi:dTDP-4-amino-4,6-dideoxygalactose transaminase
MQFRDLKTQYQVLKDNIDKAMNNVLMDCNFISGLQVSELEKQLADYVGVKHCITCANGTDALTLALMAWNIGPGDAVFVPDFTFFASGEVVSFEGATPIFVDVDEKTFNMSDISLEQAILKVLDEGILTPKVVIPVDLFGQPADYPKITKIARKYNLYILEDAAQGFGGRIKEQKACTFGDIATTSFFPAKPLGCYGDGGAIFTNDDNTAELIKSLCVHGKGEDKYDNVRIGLNSRLDTLQAAILQVKLDAFIKYELEKVNKAANFYTDLLKDVIKTPAIADGFYSSWAQYTIQLKDKEQRDCLQAYLKNKNIPSMIYYPKAMHNQSAFNNNHQYVQDLSITEKLCDTVLSLPIHPYITTDEIKLVCNSIKEFMI